MRVDASEFQRLDLRAHSLLADVPLHDVWMFTLEGGGPDRSISDFASLMETMDLERTNVVVRALFRLRTGLGAVMG